MITTLRRWESRRIKQQGFLFSNSFRNTYETVSDSYSTPLPWAARGESLLVIPPAASSWVFLTSISLYPIAESFLHIHPISDHLSISAGPLRCKSWLSLLRFLLPLITHAHLLRLLPFHAPSTWQVPWHLSHKVSSAPEHGFLARSEPPFSLQVCRSQELPLPPTPGSSHLSPWLPMLVSLLTLKNTLALTSAGFLSFQDASMTPQCSPAYTEDSLHGRILLWRPHQALSSFLRTQPPLNTHTHTHTLLPDPSYFIFTCGTYHHPAYSAYTYLFFVKFSSSYPPQLKGKPLKGKGSCLFYSLRNYQSEDP